MLCYIHQPSLEDTLRFRTRGYFWTLFRLVTSILFENSGRSCILYLARPILQHTGNQIAPYPFVLYTVMSAY